MLGVGMGSRVLDIMRRRAFGEAECCKANATNTLLCRDHNPSNIREAIEGSLKPSAPWPTS
jgi:hypothetical protein